MISSNKSNPFFQGTLKQSVSFKGKGLHTGKRSSITILPSGINTGIVFKRIDKIGKNTEISAHWRNTKQLPLCTCIASLNGDIQVRTIEHLMAAFYACGIDNALVEIKGAELPILDGSSKEFVEGLVFAGVIQQSAIKKEFVVSKTFEVKEGSAFIKIEPADTLIVDVTIFLRDIGRLNWSGEMKPEIFTEEISSARTFGRLKNGLLAQLTRFSKDPICLGANTKSAVVVYGGDQVLNKGGLRMPDEYVRHRLLDLVGDLMLSGGHIKGKITAVSPAHRMTHALLEKIFTEDGYTSR